MRVYWDDDGAKAGFMYARIIDGANGIYNDRGDWEGMYRYETLPLLRGLYKKACLLLILLCRLELARLVHYFQMQCLQLIPVNLR